MKKLINLIALVMLVSVNVLTPFTYAGDEIVENEAENVGEVTEISEDDAETPKDKEEIPENIADNSGEAEQDLQVNDEQESDSLEYQDDENASNVLVDITESGLEKESENQDEGESEESLELEEIQEPIVMDIVPNTSVTLLPGTGFNSVIKTLAGQSGATSYTQNTTITQIVLTGNIPTGVITGEISITDSEYPVYAYFTGGTIYYTTQAETIYMNSDSSYMFYNMGGLTSLDINHFKTSNIISMYYMFGYCNSLTGLDLSNWDTSNVTDMYGIFRGSNNLRELNLSGWNFTKYHSPLNSRMGLTSQIKKLNMTNTIFSGSMEEFFYSLGGLQELILDGVDTSNVTSMEQMFSYNNFTGLDLSSFDTSNVTNMFQMFMGCSKLEELNLSGRDFTHYSWGDSYGSIGSHLYAWGSDAPIKKLNLTNAKFGKSLSWAFAYSNYLEEIILDGVDTSNVTDMTRTFYGCPKLIELDLSSFDTSNVKTMEWMFMYSYNLKELDLSNFDTSGVTNMEFMFYGCSGLESLNLSGWDTRNVTKMGGMFNGDRSLKTLDLSNFNTSKVTSIYSLFQGCTNLEHLKMDGWDFRNISPEGWFGGTTSLKYISMSGWRIPENFTNGLSRNRGGGGSPIEEIDVSNWDLSQAKDLQGLFGSSASLKTIKGLDTWDTSGVTNMSQMFYGCSNLTGLDLGNRNTENVTSMNDMFNGGSNLISLDLSNWDTSNVTGMNTMFVSCTGLEKLNLNNWDLSNNPSMGGLIANTPSLKYISMSGWIIPENFTNMIGRTWGYPNNTIEK